MKRILRRIEERKGKREEERGKEREERLGFRLFVERCVVEM